MLCFVSLPVSTLFPQPNKVPFYHFTTKNSVLKSLSFFFFLCLFSEFCVFMTPKKKYDYNEFLETFDNNDELVT